MEDQTHQKGTTPAPDTSAPQGASVTVTPSVEPSAAEQRAKRWLTIGLAVAGTLLIGLVVLLTLLSINAYQAAQTGAAPSPGSVVVGLLRDAAIIFVAFETLVIGLLLIILMLQVQALTVLLREEIKPMLEAANETMSTVRGTAQFVSQNVTSPVMKWSGYVAGLQRIVKEIGNLSRSSDEKSDSSREK
jgi:uncharacterized membrane protein